MSRLTKNRLALSVLYVAQLLVVVAPVLAVIIVKKNEYVQNPAKAFSLSFGCILAFIVLLLQVLNKMPKNIHSIVKIGVISVFLWLLRPILDELCLLTTCAFGGELVGWLAFTYPIKMQKAKVNILLQQNLESSLTPSLGGGKHKKSKNQHKNGGNANSIGAKECEIQCGTDDLTINSTDNQQSSANNNANSKQNNINDGISGRV